MSAPVAVLLIGLPGVGKSHVARLLAPRLGAVRIASDDVRRMLVTDPTYTEEESALVFRVLDRILDGLLAERRRVVVDATHLQARHRAASLATARRHGVPVVHVRVVADEERLRENFALRWGSRDARDRSESDERIHAQMAALRPFEAPEGGHLELRSDTGLEAELERIAAAVEDACVRAS
ncbi:MAG: ATP-binding protein [Deltaproteobacteria bacterium]|nr:ATP-binding protein [Deltaproteobacteria bacterium]